MNRLIEALRLFARRHIGRFARLLDRRSKGKITPDLVTWVGLAMHLPIAWLIASGQHYLWAALLLIIFGLFDVLDGELARLQGTASARGMLLDASTDRFKEVILYTGAAYALASGPHPQAAAWAAAACGASLCVSYVKAKGEAAVASQSGASDHHRLNRLFKDGLLTFELRMAVLVVGLLLGTLEFAIAMIAILASITAFQRLVRIMGALR